MRDTHWMVRCLSVALTAGALVATLAACGGGGGTEQAAAPAPAEQPAGGGTAPAAEAAGGETMAGNPAAAAMGDGTATVTGTVSYTGQVPNLQPINMDADPVCAAKHDQPVYPQVLVLGPGNTMANVFVQVKGTPAKQWPAPSQPATIDQDGCMYHPHVIGVMAGQDLRFVNSDGLLHNVHGMPQQNREFNLGMPGSLKEKEVELDTPEPLFPVKCDVHPWMHAYVAVMSHPYWAVTGEDGTFTIHNLPAGSYDVEAWHEKLGTRTAHIEVADGGSATADFSFDRPQG